MKQPWPELEYSILDTNKPYPGYVSDSACWGVTIYGAVALLLCYIVTQNFRIGLPLLGLWLILPLLYSYIRYHYDRWYVSRYVGPVTLLISNTEPVPGEAVSIVLAQTFRQALIIESLTLDLIMHESWGGPDHQVTEDVIHTISQTDRPVQAGQAYKTNVTFLIPQDAKPNQRKPEAMGYDLHWLIRVTLKCDNVDALTIDYPITVIAGDTPP